MILIYNFILRAYYVAIRIAALKNSKAKEWIEGRRNEAKEIEKINSLLKINKLSNSPSKLLNSSTTTYPRIWMHCSSLGEFEQGKPVLEAIRKKYPDALIVLTFFSPSGYNIRKNEPLANVVMYLPLDTKHNALKFIETIQPTLVFFVKYDIWWHYLKTLRQKKIPTYLISAVYSKSKWQGFSVQKMYLTRALHFFTHIFLQDKNSLEVLNATGFTNLTVCGDTRVERALANAALNRTNSIVENFIQNSKTIICGSTWLTDEKFVFEWFNNPDYSDWKFIIAPHSIAPTRIKDIQIIFKDAVLYSGYTQTKNQARVLIINNIGLLSTLYRYADIVYIGGGFGKSIHNTLEPAAFGVPIIFGPKYKKFIEAVYFVKNDGAFSFENSVQLQKIISNLLEIEARKKAADVLLTYMSANAKATEKIMALIFPKS